MATHVYPEGAIYLTQDGVAAPYPLAYGRTHSMVYPKQLGQASADPSLQRELTPTKDAVDKGIAGLLYDIQGGYAQMGCLWTASEITQRAREKRPGFTLMIGSGMLSGPQMEELFVEQTKGILAPEEVRAIARLQGDTSTLVERSVQFTVDSAMHFMGLSLASEDRKKSQIELPRTLSTEDIKASLEAALYPRIGQPLRDEMQRMYDDYVITQHKGDRGKAEESPKNLQKWVEGGLKQIPSTLVRVAERMNASYLVTRQERIDCMNLGCYHRSAPFIQDWQGQLGYHVREFPAFASSIDPTVYASRPTLEKEGHSAQVTFGEETLHLAQFHSGRDLKPELLRDMARVLLNPSYLPLLSLASQMQHDPKLDKDGKAIMKIGQCIYSISEYSHPDDLRNEGEAKIMEIKMRMDSMTPQGKAMLLRVAPLLGEVEKVAQRVESSFRPFMQGKEAPHPHGLDKIEIYGQGTGFAPGKK
jgi:hypothetical protein